MAMLAAVMRDPRCEDFLETSKRPGGEHLGPQGSFLQLVEVGL